MQETQDFLQNRAMEEGTSGGETQGPRAGDADRRECPWGKCSPGGGIMLGGGERGQNREKKFFGGIPACARPFRLNALGAANEIAENRRANRHSGSSSCVISDTVPSCWCGLPGNLCWSHSILPTLLRHPMAKGAPLSHILSRAIGRRKDIQRFAFVSDQNLLVDREFSTA